MNRVHAAFIGSVLGIFAVLPASATANCGDIISEFSGEEYRTAIEDCADPFSPTTGDTISAVEYRAQGEELATDSATTLTATSTPISLPIQITATSSADLVSHTLYLHEGDDYRSLRQTSDSTLTIHATGTYTLVTDVFYPPNFVGREQRKLVWQWLMPTAHAQIKIAPTTERFAVTFKVVHEPPPEPEPTGASSVLFLPGIQASRLYTDGILGSENQLWEPNRNADVRKLSFTEAGTSVNDVYTRDVLDEIFGAFNVYQTFLDELTKLAEENRIQDFEAFAYDWRYDVFDVATKPVAYPDGEQKLLVETVRELAADSHTGKVTIIGHSNGGLVAQALLQEYGDEELAGLIDKVVFLGTPQQGTPKAIGSLLYGLDQSALFGLVIRASTARTTTQNLPGAYGLLPSPVYVAAAEQPVITTDGSELAAPIASYVGDFDHEALAAFLGDANGTLRDAAHINWPVTLRAELLHSARATQEKLAAWEAPADVSVYQVAGTGIATIEGFEYREFRCDEGNALCVLQPFVKPVPLFTQEGDGTVVLDSATAYAGNRVTAEINLKEDGAGVTNKNTKHADITESDSVQELLLSAILYPQVTDAVVIPEAASVSETLTIIGAHSPVAVVAENPAGQRVGKVDDEVVEEVVGASYFEFAGGKYLVVPTTEDIEVTVVGMEEGRYSLTIETLEPDGEQRTEHELLGATTTPGMRAKFPCLASECGDVTIDYDADGEVDATADWAGGYQRLASSPADEAEAGTGESEETQAPAAAPDATKESESRSQSTTGTRVRPPSAATPPGVVAGARTDLPAAEAAALWAALQELQTVLDQLAERYSYDHN